MATIQTKYKVGDIVFLARAAREVRMHPCPDCNGTGRRFMPDPG